MMAWAIARWIRVVSVQQVEFFLVGGRYVYNLPEMDQWAVGYWVVDHFVASYHRVSRRVMLAKQNAVTPFQTARIGQAST